MQAERWESRGLHNPVQAPADPVRVQGLAVLLCPDPVALSPGPDTVHVPRYGLPATPTFPRLRSKVTVRTLSCFRASSYCRYAVSTIWAEIRIHEPERLTSAQGRAPIPPRRGPRKMNARHMPQRRSSEMKSRNCRVCSGVQTRALRRLAGGSAGRRSGRRCPQGLAGGMHLIVRKEHPHTGAVALHRRPATHRVRHHHHQRPSLHSNCGTASGHAPRTASVPPACATYPCSHRAESDLVETIQIALDLLA